MNSWLARDVFGACLSLGFRQGYEPPRYRKGNGLRVKDTLLNIAIAVAILVGSYAIMHFFARAMYIRCLSCHTLNARRRTQCRSCAADLP